MPSMTEQPPWRLEWSDALSVGIPEIDTEHRHFTHLVNELNIAIIGRMDVDEIKKRMQLILDDAINHFSHEEELFRDWGYPEADGHAMRHAQLMQSLNEIMGNFERGGVEYEWIEAGLKVKEALIEHMLQEDMKYRDYRRSADAGSSKA